SNDGNTATAKARAAMFGDEVIEQTAQEAAGDHRERRQGRIERAGFQIQSTHACEVKKKPAEENPCDVSVAEVADGHGPHFNAADDAHPGDESFGWSIES